MSTREARRNEPLVTNGRTLNKRKILRADLTIRLFETRRDEDVTFTDRRDETASA